MHVIMQGWPVRAFSTDTESSEHDATNARADGDRAATRPPLEPREAVSASESGLAETVTGLLIANARHELRSPLQTIQGFAELLDCQAYGTLTSDQQVFVKHILQGSEELGATIEACLELAEVEAGARAFPLTRESLQPLLTEALAAAATRCGCQLRLDVRPGLASVRGKVDVDAIKRALEALVMGVATGREELSAELHVDGEYACLRVSRVEGVFGSALRTIDDLARHKRAGRGLVWLRLAAQLVAHQDGLVTATDAAERAEVRLRLSSTH